jgi:hypothetical protein
MYLFSTGRRSSDVDEFDCFFAPWVLIFVLSSIRRSLKCSEINTIRMLQFGRPREDCIRLSMLPKQLIRSGTTRKTVFHLDYVFYSTAL